MNGFNRVILMGNLTRDPQQRALPSGSAITSFGLAMNRRFRSPTGEDIEEPCFVDVNCFNRTADLAARYLRKGSSVLVEGRLKFDQWVDKTTGQNRNRLTVVAESVQFMDRAPVQDPNGGQGGYNGGYGVQPNGYGTPAPAPSFGAPAPAPSFGAPAPQAAPAYRPVTPPPPPPFEPLPPAPAPAPALAPAPAAPAPAPTAENVPPANQGSTPEVEDTIPF